MKINAFETKKSLSRDFTLWLFVSRNLYFTQAKLGLLTL